MQICKRAKADLHECPTPITFDQHYTHISIGDLHGNALKLIYTLVEEGVLQLDQEQYETLRDIYLQPLSMLSHQDVKIFKAILSAATVNPTKSITLIGDELADRGNNDYFTLLVLQKLQQSHCNVDIMMSNHSMEFMQDYARWRFTGQSSLGRQARSLQNMHSLLCRYVITEQEVRKIVDQVYTPMVKAIDYTISQDGKITLFSHAPIGLETVQALAEKFNIPYEEDPPIKLINTIDAINNAINGAIKSISHKNNLIDAISTVISGSVATYYMQDSINQNLIHAIRNVINNDTEPTNKYLIEAIKAVIDKATITLTHEQLIHDINQAIQDGNYNNPHKDLVNLFTLEPSVDPKQGPLPVDTPLQRLTWNRALGDELRTETASGIKVNFVHGHIGLGEITQNKHAVESHTNLDNNFGKTLDFFVTGDYTGYGAQGMVRHFTRHSSDIMAHQLNDYMNKNPEFTSIMTDSKKALAMQQYVAAIKNLQPQYDSTICQMEKISQDLNNKAKINPLYKNAANTVAANVAALKKTGNDFFLQPITAKSIKTFQDDIQNTCTTLEAECKKHRGWHGINAGVRMVLGGLISVLSLGIIPFIIYLTKGLGNTFCNTLDTNTATVFNKIKQQLHSNVMANLPILQNKQEAASTTENHDHPADSNTNQSIINNP